LKKKIIILVVSSFIILLVLLGYNHYISKTRNVVEYLIKEDQLINIMIAGSNVYNDRKHNFYAILSISHKNGNIGITFIPPQYRICIDESKKNYKKINEIDFYDFTQIRKTIKKDLKINIPFYMELYSLDVEKFVDLIEGIDVYILDQIENDDFVKFNLNYLDGKKTIEYINNKKNDSIYAKYDRIQDLIFSLYNSRKNKKYLNNIDLMSVFLKNIKTNILPQELFTISKFFFGEGKLVTKILPGSFNNDGYYIVDELRYKKFETNFIKLLIMKEKFEIVPIVKILNATNISGLARKMRNSLNREGLSVVEFANSPYKMMNESIIISRKGDLTAVKKVSDITGIKKIYTITNSKELINVIVIIGKDRHREEK
jgi:anionic cell wall polymer biosynthesis LytR-Cps2A-Psr (LCP) family protein